MTVKKYLTFRRDPSRPMNFKDRKKWAPIGGNSYKLLAPDLQKDVQHTEFDIKRKRFDPDKRLFIEGVANANIVDRVDERLDPRGLDAINFLKNRQLLAYHSHYDPIGVVEELEMMDKGVTFKAWIGDPETASLTKMQTEIRSLVAQGILKTVSVGFIPKKVKAPEFDDRGNLIEPMVIEEWELLEISVVAIPCNADSVFEVRGYDNNKSHANISGSKKITQKLNDSAILDMANKNFVVQSLEFDKNVFKTSEQVLTWAKDNDYSSESMTEDEDFFILRYEDERDFDEDFEEFDLDKGVVAVAGRKRKKEEDQQEDNGTENAQEEMLTLLRQIAEGIKGQSEVLAELRDSMYGDDEEEEEDDKGDGEDDEEEEDEEKSEPVEAEKRFVSLEQKFDKLVDTVKLLAEKVVK